MSPLPCPPVLNGSCEEQLRQLWDYLYQLTEQLNLELKGETDEHIQ